MERDVEKWVLEISTSRRDVTNLRVKFDKLALTKASSGAPCYPRNVREANKIACNKFSRPNSSSSGTYEAEDDLDDGS